MSAPAHVSGVYSRVSLAHQVAALTLVIHHVVIIARREATRDSPAALPRASRGVSHEAALLGAREVSGANLCLALLLTPYTTYTYTVTID